MQHRLDFADVIQRLSSWRDSVIAQLPGPQAHAEALTLKRQLDSAIAVLEFCQCFQIRPSASVTVLPDLRTMTPSCAYRVVEDNESDDQARWVELEIEGKHLELSPGDIVIEQSR